MDDLPQELIDNISSFLPSSDLKNTLTVSPKFQVAAELHSQGFKKFLITESNAEKFLATYSGRRARYLRRIRFRPMLPALDTPGEDHGCRESAQELADDDEHFTSQIQMLFQTLDSLQTQMKDNLSDFGNISLTIYTPGRLVFDHALYCLHRAYVSWRIHLLSPETLPSIGFVRTLIVKNDPKLNLLDDDVSQQSPSLRSLDLRILKDLESKLPNLQKLVCRVGGEDWASYLTWDAHSANQSRHIFQGPPRDSRRTFADVASEFQAKSMTDVDLDFLSPMVVIDWMDQRREMPDLVAPMQHDPFSTALRVLSYSMRRLNLRGVFDGTIFWPRSASEDLPYWPNLEILNVAFHPVTPSGAWYFRGLEPESIEDGFEITSAHYPPYETSPEDQEMHDDDEYIDWDERQLAQFRVIPNNQLVEPVLTAFARAAQSMPSLRVAAIWWLLQYNFNDDSHDSEDVEKIYGKKLGWGVVYAAPGSGLPQDPELESPQSANRRLYWKVADWRPSASLSELSQGIGRSENKPELTEYWDKDADWQSLEERQNFESIASSYFSRLY